LHYAASSDRLLEFLVIILAFNSVVMINENIADVNAVRQSIAVMDLVFPVIYQQLSQ
jgi:hypothetical protein